MARPPAEPPSCLEPSNGSVVAKVAERDAVILANAAPDNDPDNDLDNLAEFTATTPMNDLD